MDAVTNDHLLDGRVQLRQPVRGYRAGLDAALLAAASRCPDTRFTGIERDPDALALARENIALNGMADRVEAVEGDVAVRFSSLGLEPFDAAMTNPPFFDDSSSLRGPSAEKRAAWMADDGLAAWIGFMSKGVREGGTLTLIHRADRLADILALLGEKCGGMQILPIHPLSRRSIYESCL